MTEHRPLPPNPITEKVFCECGTYLGKKDEELRECPLSTCKCVICGESTEYMLPHSGHWFCEKAPLFLNKKDKEQYMRTHKRGH